MGIVAANAALDRAFGKPREVKPEDTYDRPREQELKLDYGKLTVRQLVMNGDRTEG
jgi:hypothetical protein